MSVPKGIDDLLASGGTPRRLQGDTLNAFFTELLQDAGSDGANETPRRPHAAVPVGPVRPSFPVDVFPPAAAELVRQTALAIGCPVDFAGVGCLVVAGAAIGASRSLHLKAGWSEKPGMYAVIVGPPGRGKSPALDYTVAPLRDEQIRLFHAHQAAKQQYEVELRNYRRAISSRSDGSAADVPAEPTEPPPMRHILVIDSTNEALPFGDRPG